MHSIVELIFGIFFYQNIFKLLIQYYFVRLIEEIKQRKLERDMKLAYVLVYFISNKLVVVFTLINISGDLYFEC